MTVQEIALQLLAYIGVYSLDPTANTNEENQRGLQSVDRLIVLSSINGAMQEIFETLVALSEKRIGITIFSPAGLTFSATKYSRVISSPAGWQSWMQGCTLQGADAVDNEFESATSLIRPHLGATGTVNATVYCDALLLPSNVKNVMEPVDIPNVGPLRVASSQDDFRFYSMFNRSGNRPMIIGETAYLTTNKTVGRPAVYMVEPVANASLQNLTVYLRLNPMPNLNDASFAMLRVRTKPPAFIDSDIGNSTDPAPTTPIPVDWHESILLPFALKRFMRHPSFENQSAQEIMQQYIEAKLLLASFKPQLAQPDAVYIGAS